MYQLRTALMIAFVPLRPSVSGTFVCLVSCKVTSCLTNLSFGPSVAAMEWFNPVATRRHSKSDRNSEHSNTVLICIVIRRRCNEPEPRPALAAPEALRVSNELYGSSSISAFKLDQSHRLPLSLVPPLLPPELLETHQTISSKRKLARLHLSKSVRI